jgi:hypothetical protein
MRVRVLVVISPAGLTQKHLKQKYNTNLITGPPYYPTITAPHKIRRKIEIKTLWQIDRAVYGKLCTMSTFVAHETLPQPSALPKRYPSIAARNHAGFLTLLRNYLTVGIRSRRSQVAFCNASTAFVPDFHLLAPSDYGDLIH